MNEPANGTLLIADPFLRDPSFSRSVVLICRHSTTEGTFGFSLNKQLVGVTLNKVISGLEAFDYPVYSGGPVGTNTLHYLHSYPEYFPDALPVSGNTFWGGDFDVLKILINNGDVDAAKIRFFLGYSGWAEGQLASELEEKSWLLASADDQLIFGTAAEQVWNASLTKLGGKYKMMIHYPTDPQLN